MTLFVDADACPVKDECILGAGRMGIRVYLVCNGGIRPSAHPLVETIYVTEGPDEADKWIAARVATGDVVVTSDIPLAARCVAAGAQVLRPDGETLTSVNIGNVLATRDLMADLRAADPFRQGGGKSFSKADRSRFLVALDQALRAAERR